MTTPIAAAAAGQAASTAGAVAGAAGTGAKAGKSALTAQQRQQQAQARQKARQKKRRQEYVRKGAMRAGGRAYQPVILAEFMVAVVLVSVSPVAKGGTAESQAKGSPSPYSVNTLKQLVAIGAVYFILALLASSRRAGRYSAWFGGLILLGLGFAELASGDLQAVFKIFGPSKVQQDLTTGTSVPGVTQGAPPGVAAPANPTAAFPTLEPGGTIVPAQAQITQNSITVPAGQSGVITTGSPPGVNLA